MLKYAVPGEEQLAPTPSRPATDRPRRPGICRLVSVLMEERNQHRSYLGVNGGDDGVDRCGGPAARRLFLTQLGFLRAIWASAAGGSSRRTVATLLTQDRKVVCLLEINEV